LPEDIKRYENTYKVGWDVIHEARYKKMIGLGIIDSAPTKLSPRMKSELSWLAN
jgi:hypothetical protein